MYDCIVKYLVSYKKIKNLNMCYTVTLILKYTLTYSHTLTHPNNVQQDEKNGTFLH